MAAAMLVVAARAAPAQESLQLVRADGASVVARAYRPSGPCAGIAIVSHGAGGSARGYRYLGEALRRGGWLALVVGHEESGFAAVGRRVVGKGIRGGLLDIVTDPAAYRARFADVGTALAWAAPNCESHRSVLLGHSMGAATAMLEAGAANRLGLAGADRFDAYVAISPQGPGSIFPEGAWHAIAKPVLFVTGTRDAALEGDWTSRRLPFDDSAPGCKWLAVIDDATHLQFAGLGASAQTERLTEVVVGAFLEGVRHGRCGTPPDAAKLSMQTR
ncbi:MAG TPA: alpha/beta fold hydrolase [Caldimonas sp.]|nr:alpha/beta fold hydrolase [Caldimonas sp.]